MSKCQKLSNFNFEDLPYEILLKILSLLDINGVLLCSQVSKRIRTVSNDQSLWSKVSIFGREVTYDLIEKAIQNGCEYLNLSFSFVHGGKKSEVPWKLKHLEIAQSGDHEWAFEVPAGVLQNCYFLQKLSVDNLMLNSYEIEHICQNGETLQILSLEGCNIDFYSRCELIEELFTKCHQLTELNMCLAGESAILGNKILLDLHVCALVNNLSPNILKLQLGSQQSVGDKHVKTLVHRCKKITELDLSFTSITNESVDCISKHLNSLEKLDVRYTDIDFSTLLQLKKMPTLKVLRCFGHGIEDSEKIHNLKLELPNISINEDGLFWAVIGEKVRKSAQS